METLCEVGLREKSISNQTGMSLLLLPGLSQGNCGTNLVGMGETYISMCLLPPARGENQTGYVFWSSIDGKGRD